MKQKYIGLAVIGILLVGLFVFGLAKVSPKSADLNKNIFKMNSSEREKMLADFLKLNNASENVSLAYQFALANTDDVLNNIPCYCGCMESGEHKNNRECFVKGDGSGFDKMGLNCGTCVGTALEVKSMSAKNASLDEIKQTVDRKFKGQES